MSQEYYDLPTPRNFDGKTLRRLRIELKAIGYDGGAQTGQGVFVYLSSGGKRIEVTPPAKRESPGLVRFYDAAIKQEISEILERVGGMR